MRQIFLDSSFVIALDFPRDQHHEKARGAGRDLARTRPLLITTSFVLAETIGFFIARNHHANAVKSGQRLFRSRGDRLFHVAEMLLARGWKLFCDRSDKTYSLTDCVSFVLMEQESVSEALTFDHHFTQAGFSRLPA